ncbi:pyrroline-5-carboxylate reductase [Pseudoclavibacter sp. RFBA6]|uniref:pyrroline-5-carboxylate reductase n=1 Tax=Pseudoclavibacter sp. RFBA6 TaxID=2080573 RepID=UPI000CE7B941|nr:pyrroline-5-carboxylate reductase [Pseudoclavibacter sp. RFBA6]PPG38281.1 pyrroline-5-carboxylate reductase [Pseudoclavibacter sp. RFBA6]
MTALTYAFLGGGNMNGAILRGLLDAPLGEGARVHVTTRSAASAAAADSDVRVTTTALENEPRANLAAVEHADVVVLGVKPYLIGELLDEIASSLKPDAVVISVAAGVRLESLAARLQEGAQIVRSMPNTPASIGLGVTGLAANASTSEQSLAVAVALFESVGRVATVDEDRIDALAAVSGSGPAHVFLLIEQYLEATKRLGFDEGLARELVVGTFEGAVGMVVRDPDTEPAELRRRVTSPNGTTERSVAELQDGDLASLFERAFAANQRRSAELAAENS